MARCRHNGRPADFSFRVQVMASFIIADGHAHFGMPAPRALCAAPRRQSRRARPRQARVPKFGRSPLVDEPVSPGRIEPAQAVRLSKNSEAIIFLTFREQVTVTYR